MAHPKSKTSKQRKRKRRTHHKLEMPQIATCPTTKEKHLYHRAYFDDEGNMFYRGKMLVKVEEEA
ncbi:MAG: 50S ribosomal protein L32 [Saprospiraceae bacterium]|nr:50S ribosomal protein L32 [Saprospiraceae bacterium]MCB0627483.1 50S ribosomal protein L32 [Saprospiraceae bacterium]MCB0679228.1 50S ribosomal protein L32 [Saprospiraceae bacterium]MCB0681198.1 50S ribosomal protein L32 [Saprospiraceae bacterium]